MSASRPVAPRDYAAAILAEPSLERRKSLMERCPVEWRERVQEYVNSAFQKVAAYRRHMAGRQEQAREKPPAAQRRDASPKPRQVSKSAPDVGKAAIAKLRAAIGQGAA